jgi:glyoxylase-like metal-dependent hydrolase (beta-lactamase superfamily II)
VSGAPHAYRYRMTIMDPIEAPKAMATLPDAPAQGGSVEIAPGVLWLRIGLPVALDHINLWAIADGPGWAIVDTGICHPGATDAWDRILREDLGGRPVTRVIVTHLHADHAGLAGWLVERFDCPLVMTRTEYLMAQSLVTGPSDEIAFRDFFRSAGWRADEVDVLAVRRRTIAGFYSPLPGSIQRIRDGDRLTIGSREWRVIAGGGHSPEHACLFCPELELFISGDMVLPRISSNISVDVLEPNADPLTEWFESLDRIGNVVPENVLVLPSHGRCFFGLHARIDALVNEQRRSLSSLLEALARPRRVDDLFDVLFSRPIKRSDIPLMSLATGETLALLNHLIANRTVRKSRGPAGVSLYQASDRDMA